MSGVLRARVSSVTQLRWHATDQDLTNVRVECHIFVQRFCATMRRADYAEFISDARPVFLRWFIEIRVVENSRY